MRSRPRHYKLVDRVPVPVDDLIEWAMWFEQIFRETGVDQRIVARTKVGPLEVSTVFLGLDHQWSPNPTAPPILFETMVFGGEPKIILGRLIENIGVGGYQERYSTWDEAEAGHQRAIEWARERVAEAEATVQFKASNEQ